MEQLKFHRYVAESHATRFAQASRDFGTRVAAGQTKIATRAHVKGESGKKTRMRLYRHKIRGLLADSGAKRLL